MSLLSRLKLRLQFFAEDCRASLSVETTIIMPLLTWWYVGSFVYFDAFRQQNVNLKAAYTLADMISREGGRDGGGSSGRVDMNYLNGLNRVFDYLTTTDKPTWIRVSSVSYDTVESKYRVHWSKTTKGKPVHTVETLNAMASRIPILAPGENVVIVETRAAYEPFFNVGLGARWFENFIVTRPRFAPCIPWEDSGC